MQLALLKKSIFNNYWLKQAPIKVTFKLVHLKQDKTQIFAVELDQKELVGFCVFAV